jgi:hypothetical protein
MAVFFRIMKALWTNLMLIDPPDKLLSSYLLCPVYLIQTEWRGGEGRASVELLRISLNHDSGSLRFGSFRSERYIIPADLSRHRYAVTLSHLETLSYCESQHSTHAGKSSHVTFTYSIYNIPGALPDIMFPSSTLTD